MKTSPATVFRFACPVCKDSLAPPEKDAFWCVQDEIAFPRVNGIWRFLRPDRESHFEKFIQDYETIRWLEKRGSTRAEYYRSLPYAARSAPLSHEWAIRSKSFEALLNQVVVPMERARNRPLNILDLGAGNCWLSNQLALRGHALAAVDLTTNAFDGLGTYCYYESGFVPVQSEFLHLPFCAEQFDLAIFNAAFHYAESYPAVLQEVFGRLQSDGHVVILDSPIYRDENSGKQMVQEREASFEQKYGFPSNAIESENFLTYQRLQSLEQGLSMTWHITEPNYGWRWKIRPLKARLLGAREPAKFLLIVGESKT